MEEKNVLLTTMSLTDIKPITNKYWTNMENEERFCLGCTSTEPGSKYFLSKHCIDEIIAVGTKETLGEEYNLYRDELAVSDLRKELGDLRDREYQKKIPPFEYYKKSIIEYLLEYESDDAKSMYPRKENREKALEGKLLIRFVPEQKAISDEGGEIDNVDGIVRALTGGEDQEINLYIDVQGGNRTSVYVRNAALSILDSQHQNKIHIKKIVSIDYKPGDAAGRIIDETKRYRISDLVSGMNAFIRYGKADIIDKYCREMEIDEKSKVTKLVKCMVRIDEAISLCDMNDLTEAIQDMDNIIDPHAVFVNKETSFVENIFHILTDGIAKDYGKLLGSPEVNYVELISWCAKKGFIQQALTLIEDKMPEIYLNEKTGLMRYRILDGDADNFIYSIGQSYEKRPVNKIFYNLLQNRKEGPASEIKKTLGITKDTDLRSKIITEQELKDLKKVIEKSLEGDREKFIKKYCEFHRKENDFEKNIGQRHYYDRQNAENLYELYQKELAKKNQKPPYFSIVYCSGKAEYCYKNKRTNSPDHIMIDFQINELSLKDKLEQLLLLHEALKKERNCCNHASKKGIRLPIRVVKHAIEIYVESVKKLFESQTAKSDTGTV